jgi:C4-dicarboxylate-specific signal transduction histidine kinase
LVAHLLVQRKRRSRAEEESQQLRDELAHISRVLAMGEIAASLAHELNQPLTAIQSYAQAAERFLAGDRPDLDEVGKSLSGIVAGNRRAKEVIERIRLVLKKEPLERAPVHVKGLIQETISLVKKAADEKKVVLRLDLDPELPDAFGDRIQLQQVLLNLIMNGFEAMGDVSDGSRELVVRASQGESDSVTLSVQDSGIGIDDDERELVFNAFFTTKDEGMGMGLSISRSIIEDHGGRIWAARNNERSIRDSF